MRLARIGVAAVMLAWPAIAVAQAAGKPAAPPATPPATAPAPAPTAGATQPAPAEPYTYNPEGRRDPFISLVSRGFQTDPGVKRAEGLSGLSTAEIVLSGILQIRGTYVALVKAPDGKTFTAHVNDRLADGTIRSITLTSMVIMQEVNDPLSLVKVKEVRKGLRASDDVKQ